MLVVPVVVCVDDSYPRATGRPYWRCYYADTNAIIFVVDSADTQRLATAGEIVRRVCGRFNTFFVRLIAAEELHQMLAEDELRDSALLVFANKQDLPGALPEAQVSEQLGLNRLKGRSWAIYKASAVKGEGLEQGLDWLVSTIARK